MNRRVKIRIGKIVSPVFVGALKVHTRITGAERSRIIVRNELGEILLVRGFVVPRWTLPGGGIKRGEHPQAAALRELYEETGIQVTDQSVTSVGELSGETFPVNYVAHIFTVKVQKEALPEHQHNMSEIIEVAWYSMDDLPDELSTVVAPALKQLSK